MYKMIQISKEEHEKCKVKIIDKGRYLWVNRNYLVVESDVANWALIFDQYDSEKQKYGQELTPNPEYQRCKVFVRNDLVDKKKKLQKIIKKIFRIKRKSGLDSIEGEIILTQYCIENKRIDAYFSKYKLGIEIDEYNHESRNSNYEKSRQLMIESHGITIDDLSKRLLELEFKSVYSIKSKCLKWVINNTLPNYKK